MKKCPKCGFNEFLVTAHVKQGWRVDSDGDFIECTDECEEVTHNPSDEDIWCCASCGYDAAGEEFNVNEDTETAVVSIDDVKELIRSYQAELDLSYDDVERIMNKSEFLIAICKAINEWLADDGVEEVTFGKYDKTTTDIVDLIYQQLNY